MSLRSRITRLRRHGRSILLFVYFSLLGFALFNYKSHCVYTMPDALLQMSQIGHSSEGKCKINLDELGRCSRNGRFIAFVVCAISVCVCVERQHQGMDVPGIWQVPDGSGEQGKIENAGGKIICGSPATLVVKGMMMK